MSWLESILDKPERAAFVNRPARFCTKLSLDDLVRAKRRNTFRMSGWSSSLCRPGLLLSLPQPTAIRISSRRYCERSTLERHGLCDHSDLSEGPEHADALYTILFPSGYLCTLPGEAIKKILSPIGLVGMRRRDLSHLQPRIGSRRQWPGQLSLNGIRMASRVGSHSKRPPCGAGHGRLRTKDKCLIQRNSSRPIQRHTVHTLE